MPTNFDPPTLFPFLLSYRTRLLRNPAASIDLGSGDGRSESSTIDGPGLPSGGLPGRVVWLTCVLDLLMLGIAFRCPGVVWKRNLPSVLGVIICSAIGDALTIVPATTIGDRRGLVGLSSG